VPIAITTVYGQNVLKARKIPADYFNHGLLDHGSDFIMTHHHPTKDFTLGDVFLARKLDEIRTGMLKDVSVLKGFNLACWCPLGNCCHADILLEIANREASAE
jgi:hypothetical protein